MDKFTSMNTFVKVVEQGSFAAAAKELALSSTMVGNHIRYLEELLSTKLIYRTTRKQSLTEAGQIYYGRCIELLDQITDAELEIKDLHDMPRGVLRVSAPITFGNACLAVNIHEYMAQVPEVELQLILSDYCVDLVNDNYDVAIRIGELPESGMVARPLKPYRLVTCASPEYLEKYGAPKIPADLALHNCLSFRNHQILRQWTFHQDGCDYPVKLNGNLSINNGQGLKEAALSGVGIIIQPEILLHQELGSGELIEILHDFSIPCRPMNLIYLPDRNMPPKLRSFIDFIVNKWGY